MKQLSLCSGTRGCIQLRVMLLALTLLLISACAHLGFPTYYDPTTYKNLTDVKPEVVFLYESFTSDNVDTNKIASIRLKLAQMCEYEKGKGLRNEETFKQVKKIAGMFDRHVADRVKGGKWSKIHSENEMKNISDAFDIAIQTERLKNKNE